jgi:hypothetical protein
VKLLGYVLAGALLLLGLVFCLSALSTSKVTFWVFAGVLFAAAALIVYFVRMRVPEQKITINQRIDISGDVELEEMKCRNCGGQLDAKNVSIEAGAIFVNCPYCDSHYQIEEAPKW